MGWKYCPVLPTITRTQVKSKTSKKSVRKDKQRAMIRGHHLQNHSPCRGCLVATLGPLIHKGLFKAISVCINPI